MVLVRLSCAALRVVRAVRDEIGGSIIVVWRPNWFGKGWKTGRRLTARHVSAAEVGHGGRREGFDSSHALSEGDICVVTSWNSLDIDMFCPIHASLKMPRIRDLFYVHALLFETGKYPVGLKH